MLCCKFYKFGCKDSAFFLKMQYSGQKNVIFFANFKFFYVFGAVF